MPVILCLIHTKELKKFSTLLQAFVKGNNDNWYCCSSNLMQIGKSIQSNLLFVPTKANNVLVDHKGQASVHRSTKTRLLTRCSMNYHGSFIS
jgi:hypothetical protein